MEPRKEEKRAPKPLEIRKQTAKRQLQIVKLEERIAPQGIIRTNHNERMVRDTARATPTGQEQRKGEEKDRFQIVRLEERIAPSRERETFGRTRTELEIFSLSPAAGA